MTVTSVPDEETVPRPTVLTVKGSRQVNDSRNHKGGSGPSRGESRSGGSWHPSCTQVLSSQACPHNSLSLGLSLGPCLHPERSEPRMRRDRDAAPSLKSIWLHTGPGPPALLTWGSQEVSTPSPNHCFPSLHAQEC